MPVVLLARSLGQEMNALHAQLVREAEDFADSLLARLLEAYELEEQHEHELAEARTYIIKLAAENADLRTRLEYLEGLIVVAEAE